MHNQFVDESLNRESKLDPYLRNHGFHCLGFAVVVLYIVELRPCVGWTGVSANWLQKMARGLVALRPLHLLLGCGGFWSHRGAHHLQGEKQSPK